MQQITPFIIINFYKAHIAISPHKGIFYWLPKTKWILGANTGLRRYSVTMINYILYHKFKKNSKIFCQVLTLICVGYIIYL